jgi:hypothetical protein
MKKAVTGGRGHDEVLEMSDEFNYCRLQILNCRLTIAWFLQHVFTFDV